MRMRILVGSAVAALSVAAMVVTSAAQADPFVGTWKTNVAKSKYSPGPAPKSGVQVVTAEAGGYKAVTDTVPATGAPTHAEVSFKFDGKDNAVKGNPNVDTTAYTKNDAHSYTATSKKGGKVTVTTKVVVSTDGKTRTATQTGTTSDGKPLNNTIVSEK